MTHDDEQRYEFFQERIAANIAEIREQLVAGDEQTAVDMDEGLQSVLFSSADWNALIIATARGQNAFAAALEKAIEKEAENMALKDLDEVDRGYSSRRKTYPRNYGAPM